MVFFKHLCFHIGFILSDILGGFLWYDIEAFNSVFAHEITFTNKAHEIISTMDCFYLLLYDRSRFLMIDLATNSLMALS